MISHIFRILFAILAFFIIKVPLVLLGAVIIPIALPFAKDDQLPNWAWLWDNAEDGINGPEWYRLSYAPNHPIAKKFPRFWWLAFRNPVNNLRFLFKIPTPEAVKTAEWSWEGPMEPNIARKNSLKQIGRYRWHGWKCEFWYIRILTETRHFRIRIGWKLLQRPGMGLTFQFMPARKG